MNCKCNFDWEKKMSNFEAQPYCQKPYSLTNFMMLLIRKLLLLLNIDEYARPSAISIVPSCYDCAAELDDHSLISIYILR